LDAKTRLEVIIALVFLVVIFAVKQIFLEKKYGIKKSEAIFNCISAMLIPYFLILNQIVLAVIVLIMLGFQKFLNRQKNNKY
jgi:hypothetical protein